MIEPRFLGKSTGDEHIPDMDRNSDMDRTPQVYSCRDCSQQLEYHFTVFCRTRDGNRFNLCGTCILKQSDNFRVLMTVKQIRALAFHR